MEMVFFDRQDNKFWFITDSIKVDDEKSRKKYIVASMGNTIEEAEANIPSLLEDFQSGDNTNIVYQYREADQIHVIFNRQKEYNAELMVNIMSMAGPVRKDLMN